MERRRRLDGAARGGRPRFGEEDEREQAHHREDREARHERDPDQHGDAGPGHGGVVGRHGGERRLDQHQLRHERPERRKRGRREAEREGAGRQAGHARREPAQHLDLSGVRPVHDRAGPEEQS